MRDLSHFREIIQFDTIHSLQNIASKLGKVCKIPCITASSIKMVVSSPDFKNTTTKKFPILEAPTPTAVNFSNLCQLRFVKGSLRVCNNISGHHFCYVGTFLRGGGFATDQKIYIHTTRQIFVQQMMKLLCRKGSAKT